MKRLLLVTLIAVMLAGSAGGQSREPPNQAGQTEQAGAKADTSAQPSATTETENSVSSDGKPKDCAYQRGQQESVVCAAWKQADWAQVQGWIQIAALGGALLTLLFTYRSLRAYVFIGFGGPIRWENNTVAVEVLLQNQGGTPAHVTEWLVCDEPVRQLPEAPDCAQKPEEFDMILGTNVILIVDRRRILPTEDRILYGFVKYKDIFGFEHESWLCSRIEGAPLRGDRPQLISKPYGPIAWRKWN